MAAKTENDYIDAVELCMGGATILIGGDNLPPNTRECGDRGGTKIIGDSALYTYFRFQCLQTEYSSGIDIYMNI